MTVRMGRKGSSRFLDGRLGRGKSRHVFEIVVVMDISFIGIDTSMGSTILQHVAEIRRISMFFLSEKIVVVIVFPSATGYRGR